MATDAYSKAFESETLHQRNMQSAKELLDPKYQGAKPRISPGGVGDVMGPGKSRMGDERHSRAGEARERGGVLARSGWRGPGEGGMGTLQRGRH